MAEDSLANRYRNGWTGTVVAESYGDGTVKEDFDLAIATAYKQVFGNAHLMESERVSVAESQFRLGEIGVNDFIRMLAKSDSYQQRFWENVPNVTAIRLNFKHLLGRAPESYAEISQHIEIIAEGGFEAEIDSYIDSDEYDSYFGTDTVPYLRGYDTRVGSGAIGYSRTFSLYGTACSSDKANLRGPYAENEATLRMLTNKPGDMPSIRPIPSQAPASLVTSPPPRVPKEMRIMAYDLLSKVRARQALRPW